MRSLCRRRWKPTVAARNAQARAVWHCPTGPLPNRTRVRNQTRFCLSASPLRRRLARAHQNDEHTTLRHRHPGPDTSVSVYGGALYNSLRTYPRTATTPWTHLRPTVSHALDVLRLCPGRVDFMCTWLRKSGARRRHFKCPPRCRSAAPSCRQGHSQRYHDDAMNAPPVDRQARPGPAPPVSRPCRFNRINSAARA